MPSVAKRRRIHSTRRSESTIGGDGAIVVGIFGSQDDTHIHSLGLITLPPAPVLAQVPANPLPLEPAGKHPPRPGPAAAPPGLAARDADVLHQPAEVVDPPAPKAPKPASRIGGWRLYAIFAVVMVGAFVASLAFLSARKRPVKRRPRTRAKPLHLAKRAASSRSRF